jgi:hypothetical protein
MATKEVKKFSLILDYSKGKYGIAFEHSESDKPGLYVGSALEAIALADLMRNSQYVVYDEETKTIQTNSRPTGEAMKEWPDLNKPEPSISTGSSDLMDGVMKNLKDQK